MSESRGTQGLDQPSQGKAPHSGQGALSRFVHWLNDDAHRVTSRYEQTRHRLDETAAGQHFEHLRQADLMREAMILAAQAFLCLIPVMITIAAISPLGGSHSVSTDFTERMGLSVAASHDVQRLFASPHDVRRTTTEVGIAVAILFAYGWPSALRRGYEATWRLSPRGSRDMWRGIVWILIFLVGAVAVVVLSVDVHGRWGQFGVDVLTVLLVLLGTWWTQHLLLGGRVAWRALLPGAVAITVGLFGLRWFTSVLFSGWMVSNQRSYGPMGTVFILMAWVVGFSFVMLGGAVVGQSIYEARRDKRGSVSPVVRLSGRPNGPGAR